MQLHIVKVFDQLAQSKGKTVMSIAHRPSTLVSSNKILCFSNGVLSQAGGSYKIRAPKDTDAATSASFPENVEVASIRVAKEKVRAGPGDRIGLGLGLDWGLGFGSG